jgi:hypothetical protein
MVLVCLLFGTQALAASGTSVELAALSNEWDTVFPSLLEPLQVAVCELVRQEPAQTFWDQTLIELEIFEICLEELILTIVGLVGLEIDADATAYDSPLPITDPKPENYCDISTADVCFQYPNWNETEVYCTKAPNQDACECGTGNLVCYPLDPRTGGCYN